MERIATSLMFVGDQYGKAEEAVNLYVSLVDDSRVDEVVRQGDEIQRILFTLAGRPFTAMDSGAAHDFTFTPAISLTVEFSDAARLDAAFAALSDGGGVLMPLAEYDFSPRFAWVADRFGVSWQLILA
jgi:predicted 3-demethylubiquinone-9 3-methyltransferase (glyoxalase superfamily)